MLPALKVYLHVISSFVVGFFKLCIVTTSLPRRVSLPSQLLLLSSPLFSALLYIALHLNPLLFRVLLLLLLLIVEELLEEFRYAKEIEENEVANEDGRDEQKNECGPHLQLATDA